MIEITITKEDIALAKDKAADMGKLQGSITNGKGNIFGWLGKIVVARYLNAPPFKTYDFDMVLGDGTKVQVKTKKTSVQPLTSYECSVTADNLQECDWYVFVRVKNDLSKAWILGYLPKDEFLKIAMFMHKGEKHGDNGWIVSADCYNVLISALKPLQESNASAS